MAAMLAQVLRLAAASKVEYSASRFAARTWSALAKALMACRRRSAVSRTRQVSSMLKGLSCAHLLRILRSSPARFCSPRERIPLERDPRFPVHSVMIRSWYWGSEGP